MNKITLLGLVSSLIIFSCTDPNSLGLDVHPSSDVISFSDTSSFSWQTSQTEQGDSIRTDEALNLILGEIEDPIFGYSRASFYTQLLLSENNIELGPNPQVDSVILSYTYSDYYGDEMLDFQSIQINRIDENIYRDSIYYSSSFDFMPGETENWVEEHLPKLKRKMF